MYASYHSKLWTFGESSAQGDILTISGAGSKLSQTLSATAESGGISTDNGYQDSTAQALENSTGGSDENGNFFKLSSSIDVEA